MTDERFREAIETLMERRARFRSLAEAYADMACRALYVERMTARADDLDAAIAKLSESEGEE
jgi:uncharacterized protein YigA (DUF484 family)